MKVGIPTQYEYQVLPLPRKGSEKKKVWIGKKLWIFNVLGASRYVLIRYKFVMSQILGPEN